MVSAVLLEGDLSLNASCTVTTIVDGRVYVCGHPLFGFGSVQMPMARARVLTTLSSDLESTKIVNVGGTIGSFSQDRVTAVMGKRVPHKADPHRNDRGNAGWRQTSFFPDDVESRSIILMGLAALNGLVQNPVYGEGTTLRLTGGIDIAGHSSVNLENLFTPTDSFIPDGMSVLAPCGASSRGYFRTSSKRLKSKA